MLTRWVSPLGSSEGAGGDLAVRVQVGPPWPEGPVVPGVGARPDEQCGGRVP